MVREMEEKLVVLETECKVHRDRESRRKNKPAPVTIPELGPTYQRLWDDIKARSEKRKRQQELARAEIEQKLLTILSSTGAASFSSANAEMMMLDALQGKAKLNAARRIWRSQLSHAKLSQKIAFGRL